MGRATTAVAEDVEPTKAQPAAGPRRVVSLGSMLGAKKLPTAITPLAEFTSYLQSCLQLPEEPMECDILQWWAARESTFPTVSKMARQYVGAPASSAAVERLFSGAGRNYCSSRHGMKADRLEQVMWAREWVKHAY